MTELTLNNCLSKLNTIIFGDIDNHKDEWEIRQILEEVRKYIIESTIQHKKKYNKRSFMVILKFINYLIQESYEPITHLFNSHIKGLRFLVIRFKDNHLLIGDEEIDFDGECNTFLRKIVENDGHDYGYDDGDYEDDDKSEDED